MRGVVYDTGHHNSTPVCEAFAAGAGWPIEALKRRKLGDLRPCFFYGMKRGGRSLYNECIGDRRKFFFGDNGYFGRRWQPGGYYRIGAGHWIEAPIAAPDPERWASHGIPILPWREAGRQVLVSAINPEYAATWQFDGEAWLQAAVAAIQKRGRRKILVMHKSTDPRFDPKAPPLSEQLAGAHALVTRDSNVCIEALCAGVPIFVTGRHPARTLALADLSRIETPALAAGREDLMARLAANQWTLAEFAAGVPQRALGIV